jgi:Flp pilus assembly pilin Flp
MVEYALMIALVAAACVVAVTALGTAVAGEFTTVSGNF